MFKILEVFLLFHRVVMEGVLMEGGRGGQGRGHSPIPPLPISEQQSNGDETNTAQSSNTLHRIWYLDEDVQIRERPEQ